LVNAIVWAGRGFYKELVINMLLGKYLA
jgi:uncharacterized membrane protein YqaE (UPF0057 family)